MMKFFKSASRILVTIAVGLLVVACGNDDEDEGKPSTGEESTYEFTIADGDLAGKTFSRISPSKYITGFTTSEKGTIVEKSTVEFIELRPTNTFFQILWKGQLPQPLTDERAFSSESFILLSAKDGETNYSFESINGKCEVTKIKTIQIKDPITAELHNAYDFEMSFQGTFKNVSGEGTVKISGKLKHVNVIN